LERLAGSEGIGSQHPLPAIVRQRKKIVDRRLAQRESVLPRSRVSAACLLSVSDCYRETGQQSPTNRWREADLN